MVDQKKQELINRFSHELVGRMDSFSNSPVERAAAISLFEADYLLVLTAHSYSSDEKTIDGLFNLLHYHAGAHDWSMFLDDYNMTYEEQISLEPYIAFSFADDKTQKNAMLLLLCELRRIVIWKPEIRKLPLEDVEAVQQAFFSATGENKSCTSKVI